VTGDQSLVNCGFSQLVDDPLGRSRLKQLTRLFINHLCHQQLVGETKLVPPETDRHL
jgi:hypothetical protein